MKKTLPNINFLKKLPALCGFALLVILNFGFNETGYAQSSVGIGTVTPDKSAALDVSSTNSGVLVPRMTLVQRNAIATPANGLLIYNTNDLKFNYWNGTMWEEVGSGITWFSGQGYPTAQPNSSLDKAKLSDLYLDEITGDIWQREVLSFPPTVLDWWRKNPNKKNKQQFTVVAGPSATIASGASNVQTFTFQGAGLTNAVVCSPNFDDQLPNVPNVPNVPKPYGVIMSRAWVSDTNKISVEFYNPTGASISLAGKYQIAIF